MATIGNPTVIFAGITWSSANCIQVATFTDQKEDITYRCGGDFAHLAGTSTIALDFSVALGATDTTQLSGNLDPGTTSTATYYPFGTTVGRIKYSTTKATCIKCDLSDSAGKVVSADVTLVWDNVTKGAAT